MHSSTYTDGPEADKIKTVSQKGIKTVSQKDKIKTVSQKGIKRILKSKLALKIWTKDTKTKSKQFHNKGVKGY